MSPADQTNEIPARPSVDYDRQEIGVDALEMDTVFTKDGIPVIWHDVSASLSRIYVEQTNNCRSMPSALRNVEGTLWALTLQT